MRLWIRESGKHHDSNYRLAVVGILFSLTSHLDHSWTGFSCDPSYHDPSITTFKFCGFENLFTVAVTLFFSQVLKYQSVHLTRICKGSRPSETLPNLHTPAITTHPDSWLHLSNEDPSTALSPNASFFLNISNLIIEMHWRKKWTHIHVSITNMVDSIGR